MAAIAPERAPAPTAGKHRKPCRNDPKGEHDWSYSGMANIYFCTKCGETDER